MGISKKIKLLRKEILCLSQEEFALLINVSRNSIKNWENNISKPNVRQIKRISQVSGIATDFILFEKKGYILSSYNMNDDKYKIIKEVIAYYTKKENDMRDISNDESKTI